MTYRTIVVDPPWEYPGGTASGIGSRRTRALPYPTMTLGQIHSVPVSEMADSDCRLFLWTTNRFLPEAFGLIEGWGFEYGVTLVWAKTNPAPAVRFRITPGGAEFLLVARRGHPKACGVMPTVISAPAVGHSQKPECFLDYIERVSPGPYLELFARRNRFGWDTWGNESLEMVEL